MQRVDTQGLKKIIHKNYGLKPTSRQVHCLAVPFDRNYDYDQGSEKRMGPFHTILSVDKRPDYPEIIGPDEEWHSSCALLTKDLIKDAPDDVPFIPLSGWTNHAFKEGIRYCENMLKGVGEGEILWTGEFFSLHARKKLTELEKRIMFALSLRIG